MDGFRFDTLTKTLATVGSRRQALGGLLVASLALLGGAPTEEAAAHNAKKQCQKKSGDAKKQCLKKAKKHNRQHTTQTPSETPTIPPDATPVPPPPPAEMPATCSDGVKNGSESDVDCGGPMCARCALGQACSGAADCSTSRCVNNVCRNCAAAIDCPTGCTCQANIGGCINLTPVTAAVCVDCPRYSFCSNNNNGTVNCYPPCA